MKKLLLVFTLFFSVSVFAQNTFWYDVLLEVKAENAENVASLVDNYYSSIEIPENVSVEFSSIPFKGTHENATHILSFVSNSAESLGKFRGSLTGSEWDLYISKMQKNVENVRTSAGNGLVSFNSDVEFPIGQAWVFKVKDIGNFVNAFGKLMKTFKFEGSVGAGQIVHGTDNGENAYIYGTYANLSKALSFGPKNDRESKAFELFNQEISNETFSKTFTRVLIKRF